jgi:hypothetical protein
MIERRPSDDVAVVSVRESPGAAEVDRERRHGERHYALWIDPPHLGIDPEPGAPYTLTVNGVVESGSRRRRALGPSSDDGRSVGQRR